MAMTVDEHQVGDGVVAMVAVLVVDFDGVI